MRGYRIPTENGDLKKYAVERNAKRLLGFLAYVAFFVLAFLFFINGRHETEETLALWVYPVFYGAVVLSGWILFYMTRFVFDRSFTGRIESMELTRNYDRGLNRSAGVSLDEHTYIKIRAKDAEGRTRRVRCRLFDDGYDRYYSEGDEIVHFRGLNYPLSLPSEEKGMHLCTVCGVRTYYKEGKAIHGEAQPRLIDGHVVCNSCGRTLINIDELK